jgi:hypothetical protein
MGASHYFYVSADGMLHTDGWPAATGRRMERAIDV